VLTRILSPAAINVLRMTFAREAEALVERLVEQREFDGIAELAEPIRSQYFLTPCGLAEEGRENLLPTATWCSTRLVRATTCSTRR